MTTLSAFLDTYWWIIPLAMMALCFLAARRGGMCSGGWEADESGENALKILDRRFARGEIDKMEYEEKFEAINRRNRS